MEDLYQLAQWLQQKAVPVHLIAQQVRPPLSSERIVEHVMYRLLRIETQLDRVIYLDSDLPQVGRFTEGELAEKTVVVCHSQKHDILQSLQDFSQQCRSDYLLLVEGMRVDDGSVLIEGGVPTIESVYLIAASDIADILASQPEMCEANLTPFQIYPEPCSALLRLSEEQRSVLEQFSLAELESERRWQELFEISQHQIEKMAEAAHCEYLQGKTEPLTLE